MSGTSISQVASFVSSHEQNHGPEPGSLRTGHGPNEAIASHANRRSVIVRISNNVPLVALRNRER
jgi:hypothetical protein